MIWRGENEKDANFNAIIYSLLISSYYSWRDLYKKKNNGHWSLSTARYDALPAQ